MSASNPEDLNPQIRFVPSGPENLFHVSDVSGRALACTGSMPVEPWSAGIDGRPSHAALGVLLDVVLGCAAIANAPAGHWGVTIDMFAAFAAPMPAYGNTLIVRAGSAHSDRESAVGTGTVMTPDGKTIAVGTERIRFAPGEPAGPIECSYDDRANRAQSLLELLGAWTTVGEDPTIEILLDADSRLANPGGTLHGGVQFTLAAQAALLAVAPMTLSSLHIAFIRAGPVSSPVRVRTSITYRGRTAALVEIRCLRQDGKVCSVANATCTAVPLEPD